MKETNGERVNRIYGDWNYEDNIANEDVDWLIEQAKKVELLEMEKSELLCELGRSDTKLINIKQIINE